MSSIPSDIMKSTKQKQNKLRSQVWWQPQHFGRGGKRVQNLRPFSQPHNSVLARVIQDPVSKPEATTKHYRRADGSLFLGDSKRSCLEWHMLACGCPGRKSVINWCRRHQGFTCDKAGKTSLWKSGEFASVASAASAKAWKLQPPGKRGKWSADVEKQPPSLSMSAPALGPFLWQITKCACCFPRQAWALVGVIDGGSSSCNESVRNYENHSTGGKALAQGEFYTLDGQKFSVTAYSEWIEGRQRWFEPWETRVSTETESGGTLPCSHIRLSWQIFLLNLDLVDSGSLD